MRIKPDVHIQVLLNALDHETADGSQGYDDNAYVAWITRLETLLSTHFADAPLELLHSERYWQLNSASGVVFRRDEVRQKEIERLVGSLKGAADVIRRKLEQFGPHAGVIGVLDTNAVLHHKQLKDVRWDSHLGAPPLTLVIPLCVVDELDDKKGARDTNLARRAGNRLRQLERSLYGNEREIRPGVTVQVVDSLDLDERHVRRPSPPVDIAVLDTCDALRAYAGDARVRLVTGDLGMRVRTSARDVPTVVLPDSEREPLAFDQDEEPR